MLFILHKIFSKQDKIIPKISFFIAKGTIMILALFSYPIKLLLSYGYIALFIWSILEGEIGLMLSGFLASNKELFDFSHIIIVASAGAFIGDNILFFLGRYFEPRAKIWLIKYKDKRIVIQRYFRKYGAFVIVFERFIYGTHIPALLIVGLSKYPYAKFFFFDIIGIILWASVFTSIGYYFGNSAIDIIIFVQKNLLAVLFIVILIYLLIELR